MNNEMMEAIESTFTKVNRGDILEGEILFVTDNEVMVNINYKSDGIITKDELSNDPNLVPKDLFKVGDKINVFVLRMDDGEGNVVLSSKRVHDNKNWDVLEEIFNNGETIEVTVINNVKGGLAVLAKDLNGFMPASHVSVNYVNDLGDYKGKKLVSKIIDFDKSRRRMILSRREVEKVELDEMRKGLWDKLEEGALVTGVVQRLTNFGAFVDLGGLDGLIHISDLSWNRIKSPSEVVKPGEEVTVKVLSIDKERNRISLGLKQTTEEPWKLFMDNVKVGDKVAGKVVNLLDFGAFVRLNEGVDGLLHVSQISNEHIAKPADVLEMGQELEVEVISIDEENKKISLSTKEEMEEVKEETPENKEELEVTLGEISDQE